MLPRAGAQPLLRAEATCGANSLEGIGSMVDLAIQIIAFGLIGITIAAAALGLVRNPRWYWVGAVSAYLVSAGSVAGMLLVSASFVHLALALGHSAGWIRSPAQSVGAVIVGIAVWAVVAATVDDYWVFFPIPRLIPDSPA